MYYDEELVSAEFDLPVGDQIQLKQAVHQNTVACRDSIHLKQALIIQLLVRHHIQLKQALHRNTVARKDHTQLKQALF